MTLSSHCDAGADVSGPPGGGAVQPHPEAFHWYQLPICGSYSGGYEYTAGGSAAAGAGSGQTQEANAAQILSVELSGACVSSSTGPGVVSSHRHAGGKHDVRAR